MAVDVWLPSPSGRIIRMGFRIPEAGLTPAKRTFSHRAPRLRRHRHLIQMFQNEKNKAINLTRVLPN